MSGTRHGWIRNTGWKLIFQKQKRARVGNDKFMLLETPLSTAIWNHLMLDAAFIQWPASIDKHHTFNGGLSVHTVEVVALCRQMIRMAPRLNADELFSAAMLHDLGKIDTYIHTVDGWGKVSHYTKSFHIVKSIERATVLLEKYGAASDQIQRIIRIIGSHHGQIAWGALWEPETPEGWALHLADMNSVFVVSPSKRPVENK